MECADQCLSLQEAYLQKRALCNISYEISSKCCNHEHILKQVGAFNSRFASKSVEDSARYTIGNMPFTLLRSHLVPEAPDTKKSASQRQVCPITPCSSRQYAFESQELRPLAHCEIGVGLHPSLNSYPKGAGKVSSQKRRQ